MSTVHIRLKDIFDVAVTCNVIFYPADTPFINGPAMVVSGAHSILIDADGEGSVTLLPGRYTVRFSKITGNTDTLIILVPDEEGSYELQDLICSGNWILPFRDFVQKSRNLADLADPAGAFAAIKQPATTLASGVVQLASQAEVEAGTNTAKVVTPATLAAGLGSMGYELKSGAFTATQGGRYAVDTSAGSFNITIDAALPVGRFVEFADARGTWNNHPPTFVRNGHRMEGIEVNYTDSAQGSSLRILNVGGTTGLRILESGTKPTSLTLPTITSGHYVGSPIQSTQGAWTGSPSTFAYQWQLSSNGSTGWADVLGATASVYVPVAADAGKYARAGVTAANVNGSSLPAFSAPSAALVLPDFPVGAVAYYRLNETSGPRADATGNGRTLTDNNEVASTQGKLGNAALFEGFNYLSGPYVSTNSFTITCWANCPDVYGYQQVVGIDDFSNQIQLEFFGSGFGGPFFQVISGSGNQLSMQRDMSGTHFLAASYDLATKTATLYVDNEKVSRVGLSPGGSGGEFSIGGQYGDSFNGWIDEVGFWDRALSDYEIAQIYNNGNGISFPA